MNYVPLLFVNPISVLDVIDPFEPLSSVTPSHGVPIHRLKFSQSFEFLHNCTIFQDNHILPMVLAASFQNGAIRIEAI